MKQLLISDDKTVTKIVHDDGSETAIKTVSSCDSILKEDGTYELRETDRNKYSVFISDSVGCYMKCKFCYLTIKDMKYKKLQMPYLGANITEAFRSRRDEVSKSGLQCVNDMYIKLCWMGMGDAIRNTGQIYATTMLLMEHVMERGYARGLDGVDISTVMPNIYDPIKSLEILKTLDAELQEYPLNPHNDTIVHRDNDFSNIDGSYPNRSRVRLFYSLHSAVQKTRDHLIPNAMPIDEAIPLLLNYSENNKYNVIFHHMFIDGVNDSEEEIKQLINLIKFYNLYDYELRILRYNTCEVSGIYHESERFKEIIKQLMKEHKHIKVQISAGKEVEAACGQFLVTD